jgi:NAD(P)H dehydrogenase (quinone)
MKSETESTLLVTGASGQLGRRVVELLLETHPAARVIAGSRDPGKLADLADKGASLRPVDFDDPEGLATAFAGVDRLLIVSTDAVMVPGQRLHQHLAAIRAAQQAGVKHVIYTSTVNAEENSVLAVAPDHLATENALEQSSLGYTILRNNYYADNLLPGLAHALQEGKWYHAAGEGAISYATREDCAAVAASALASGFDGRRTLEVTGPEALTIPEVAVLVATVTGRPLEPVPVPVEALVSGLVASGLPDPVARLIASFDHAAALGALAPLTATVKDLTGREPQALAEFLATHASKLKA